MKSIQICFKIPELRTDLVALIQEQTQSTYQSDHKRVRSICLATTNYVLSLSENEINN